MGPLPIIAVMLSKKNPGDAVELVQLHERAADNLRFIRETMESASRFTEVSGKGMLLAGVSAMTTVRLQAWTESSAQWLMLWMAELAVAATLVLGLSARKARAQGASLWSHAGRKLLLAFTPPMLAGGLLTLALFMENRLDLVPGVWLCLYGAGVMTAGMFSIALVPVMGAAFMLAGAAALLLPGGATLMTLLGFGGLHVVFGALIWRKYGG